MAKMTMREMSDAFGVPYHTVVQAVRAQVPLERRTKTHHELFDAETVAEYLLRWCGRKQAEAEDRLDEILAQMRRIEAVAHERGDDGSDLFHWDDLRRHDGLHDCGDTGNER